MRPLGVLLVIAACAGPVTPVMPDGAPIPDGPPDRGGLVVSWNADPGLPGAVTDKITVTEATFQIDFLQIESDLGPADQMGHSRTLHWIRGTSPDQDAFPDAPAANYQNILITLRPGSSQ